MTVISTVMSDYLCSYCGSTFDRSQALAGHIYLAHGKKQGISRSDLIDEIQRLADSLEKTPTFEEMRQYGEHSGRVYQKKFGSWNNAIQKAGLTPNVKKGIPKSDLKDELYRLEDELGRIPSSVDLRRQGEFCLDTYLDRFGDWETALRSVGFEAKQSYVDAESRSYGPIWKQQRQRAIERDNRTCIVPWCGMTREKHREQYDTDIHVHHIKPMRTYVDEDRTLDHENAHKLSNLVTVCSEHHPFIEVFCPLVQAMYQVPLQAVDT